MGVEGELGLGLLTTVAADAVVVAVVVVTAAAAYVLGVVGEEVFLDVAGVTTSLIGTGKEGECIGLTSEEVAISFQSSLKKGEDWRMRR